MAVSIAVIAPVALDESDSAFTPRLVASIALTATAMSSAALVFAPTWKLPPAPDADVALTGAPKPMPAMAPAAPESWTVKPEVPRNLTL